ncbi:MAG: efflux RND transporter periplasmic adaptor subunit [Rhodothermales bacterium]
MKRHRILTVATVALVVAILAGVRYKRMTEKENMPLLRSVPTSVQVATVRVGRIESVNHVLGEVHGADEADVASRVVSTVDEIRVREGQRVKKGEVLAVLDSQELRDAVLEAEANVEAAQMAQSTQAAATARDGKLFENEAISQEQWERSQSAETASRSHMAVANAQLHRARTRMAYAVVRSPVDGVVSARLVDPGDLAVLGHPLVRVIRQNTVRVRAKVPPAVMLSVKEGTPVDLEIREGRLRLTVSRVFPAMEDNHLGTIEIDVVEPSPDLVVGATVGVDLHLEGGKGLLVPLDALLEGGNGAHVLQIQNSGEGGHSVHVVDVSVANRSLVEAVVEGELNEGDEVVVARPSRLMGLAEGMIVSPVHSNDER